MGSERKRQELKWKTPVSSSCASAAERFNFSAGRDIADSDARVLGLSLSLPLPFPSPLSSPYPSLPLSLFLSPFSFSLPGSEMANRLQPAGWLYYMLV